MLTSLPAYPWPGWRTTYEAYELDEHALMHDQTLKLRRPQSSWDGEVLAEDPAWAAFATSERIIGEGDDNWLPVNFPLDAEFERYMPVGFASGWAQNNLAESIIDLRGTPLRFRRNAIVIDNHLPTSQEDEVPAGTGYRLSHHDKVLQLSCADDCGWIRVEQVAIELELVPIYTWDILDQAALADIASGEVLLLDKELFDIVYVTCTMGTFNVAGNCFGSDRVFHSSSLVCPAALHAGIVDPSISDPQEFVLMKAPLLQEDGYEGKEGMHGVVSQPLENPQNGFSFVVQAKLDPTNSDCSLTTE